MAFRWLLILRIAAASPSRFYACDRPPTCVMSCLAPREGSTDTWLVDGERAHFHGVASRLTIASSNARVPPLFRPYPLRHQTLLRYKPHPPKARLYSLEYDREKNISDNPSGRSWRRYCTKTVYSIAICTWLSRQLMNPRIALSPLVAPYRAKPGTATGFLAPTTER
jgi:hypothetical protein